MGQSNELHKMNIPNHARRSIFSVFGFYLNFLNHVLIAKIACSAHKLYKYFRSLSSECFSLSTLCANGNHQNVFNCVCLHSMGKWHIGKFFVEKNANRKKSPETLEIKKVIKQKRKNISTSTIHCIFWLPFLPFSRVPLPSRFSSPPPSTSEIRFAKVFLCQEWQSNQKVKHTRTHTHSNKIHSAQPKWKRNNNTNTMRIDVQKTRYRYRHIKCHKMKNEWMKKGVRWKAI